MNIAIIDYGVGNILSIQNAFKFVADNIKIEVVNKVDKLKNYDKIILPGVGAFGEAIKLIKERNFDEALAEEVKKGKFILGICLGMQLLGTKSFEGGEFNGLNLIEGEIKKFESIKIPHIGWNEVNHNYDKLFNNIENKSDFYFVHSYFFECKDKKNQIATTSYGIDYACVIKKENIYGVQFHPEKSQKNGLILIKNFIYL